ncbi:MAG TPA: histidine phosphatase family protein [Acidimicrobiales bacterium]|nr:histidine phosphatase family protein [Acidimicrobiales bacterium]
MLILARHGQTSVNAGGRLQGRADAPLTDLGRRQADAIAAVVGTPALVVASPLRRARETAARINADVVVDERWIELDYGEWDGMPLSDVPAAAWQAWRHDPSFAPPGGESLVDLGARVRPACEELRETAAGADVVVVSHVSPIKAAAAWALGTHDEVSWRMFLDVAAISRIRTGMPGPSLVAWNDRCHLALLD